MQTFLNGSIDEFLRTGTGQLVIRYSNLDDTSKDVFISRLKLDAKQKYVREYPDIERFKQLIGELNPIILRTGEERRVRPWQNTSPLRPPHKKWSRYETKTLVGYAYNGLTKVIHSYLKGKNIPERGVFWDILEVTVGIQNYMQMAEESRRRLKHILKVATTRDSGQNPRRVTPEDIGIENIRPGPRVSVQTNPHRDSYYINPIGDWRATGV